MKPLVSILIPVFNGEEYILETLKSISHQSIKSFEAIIINDGSTDSTAKIVQEYVSTDKRFRLFTRDNQGMAASLNFAINESVSDLVARIDADDLMAKNRLERQLSFLDKNPSVSVASSYVYLINNKSQVVGKNQSKYTTETEICKAMSKGKLIGIPHPGVIAKKNIILQVGGYRGQFWPSDDVDLWTRVVEHGGKILIQPEFLTYYRIHSSSVSVDSALKARTSYRWVSVCQQARLRGEKEPTIEEFQQLISAVSFARKITMKRHDYSFLYYKKSAACYASRNRLNALIFFICSFLLRPRQTLSQAFTRIKFY